MPCGCTQVLEPDARTTFTVCDNAGSPAFTEQGISALVQGSATLTVFFVAAKAVTTYGFIELAVENLIDPTPLSIVAEVTARALDSFTVSLDGIPDTGNYRLRWNVYVASL